MWGVWSLGGEDPLEASRAPHSSVLAWGIPRTEEPGSCSPWGYRGSDTVERAKHMIDRASHAALVVKNLPANAGDTRNVDSISGSGRSPGGGHGKPPTPGFLPGESRGQGSLVGYSPWGPKEWDTTEQLNMQSQRITSWWSVVRTKTISKADRAYSSFQNVKHRVNDGITRLVNEWHSARPPMSVSWRISSVFLSTGRLLKGQGDAIGCRESFVCLFTYECLLRDRPSLGFSHSVWTATVP